MTTSESPQTLAQWLDLPPGWIAENYAATIEMHWPRCLENQWSERRATIARPYRSQSREWWIACARESISQARTA
jgi:hypothetical protein